MLFRSQSVEKSRSDPLNQIFVFSAPLRARDEGGCQQEREREKERENQRERQRKGEGRAEDIGAMLRPVCGCLGR